MTYPFSRIRVRILDVRITCAGLNVAGVAAVDEQGDVHFVVAGDDAAAHGCLLDMVDGPDMYEVVDTTVWA